MKNIPLLLGSLVVSLLLIVGNPFTFSAAANPKPVDVNELLSTAKHTKGPAEAKVTIVEFSDLQCPACRAVQPLIKQIMTKYPQDVRFVYRHFPLRAVHPHAQLAAQASEVAADAGKFWEFHDMLFETQAEWSSKNPDEVKAIFADDAQKLEIDKSQFLQKIESQTIKDTVAEDVRAATKLGINATPTFYVNGIETTAPQLLKTVESLLQAQP